MSLFFLLNNLHFALEILGALTFLMVAWLAFDSLLVRRDFLTAARSIGFGLLTLWQVIHAFNFPSDTLLYLGYGVYLLGIGFVLWNLVLERPIKRPEFKAIMVLPALGVFIKPLSVVIAAGLFLASVLSFRQYKKELKKTLVPFWIGFLLLSLGAASSIFYSPDSLSVLWAAGHLLELAGFFAIAWWVWSYLQTRIREEMILIFISVTLFMATIVTLTFSSILITRIEEQTKSDLLVDARVLDFTISRFQEESLAKAKFLAGRSDINTALIERNFVRLEALLTDLIEKENLGFLAILDNEGNVILRAHDVTRKDDNLSEEGAVTRALAGESFVTIESSPSEGFSIRAASPLKIGEFVEGVIVAGFPLDNLLADEIKKITGLEMSIFEGNTRVATTALNPDGRTRSVGIKQVDAEVASTVLESGNELTLRTVILSRPYLASYLPIRNADGEVVGMISAAKSQHEILETAQATNRLTLIAVMVIMLILITPIYFITRRLSEETV